MSKSDQVPAFDFICPMQWNELEKTANKSVRFCSLCCESVHLAKNNEELAELGRQKKCAAIENTYESLLTGHTTTVAMIGEPRATYLAVPPKTGRLSRLWRKLRVLFARYVRSGKY